MLQDPGVAPSVADTRQPCTDGVLPAKACGLSTSAVIATYDGDAPMEAAVDAIQSNAAKKP
jgi:hypothetical protein